jgi:hypothetical protein
MFPLHKNPRGLTLICIETVFLALDLVVVVLRFWSRRIKRTRLGLNDYTIALALVCMQRYEGRWY